MSTLQASIVGSRTTARAACALTLRHTLDLDVDRFWIKNFGCRASQADGAAIESGLVAKGLAASSESADADVLVLNTCTVTSTADDEVRQTVRRLHRERPDARILITGCYAQRAPEELAAMPGVSLVVGNSHKSRIPEFVAE